MTPEQQAKLAEIARRQRLLGNRCVWLLPFASTDHVAAEYHPQ